MVEAAVFQQLLADESVAAQVMEIFEPEDWRKSPSILIQLRFEENSTIGIQKNY
jgi:hypothetical protein